MVEPTLIYLPDGFQWDITEASLSVQFRDVHTTSAGMFAEVEIFQVLSGERKNHYWADLNLKAERSKTSLAKLMALRVPSFSDWEPMIEMVCYLTARAFRVPTESETVGLYEPPEREFRLQPFLAMSEPSVFFGEGGAGKTELMVLLCCCITSGISLAGLDPVQGKVMYLDYETDKDTFGRRLRKLARGMKIEYPSVEYYRGGAPLAKDIASVKANVLNKHIDHIFIDSASLAVGGQLEDTAAVGQFFSALRQLGIGSTIITHTAKNREHGSRTAFGSVYWTNLARSVWEVIGSQEEGSNYLSMAVKHTKVNEQGKMPRIGLGFTFYGDTTEVTSEKIADLPGLDFMIPSKQRVEQAIINEPGGRASIKRIIELTELTDAAIQSIFKRNPRQFFKFEGGGRGKPTDYGVSSNEISHF